jgi:hypothetical protein
MNIEWENSWKAKKITKETINEMNIPLSTKKLLIEGMFDREDCCYRLCNFIEACRDFIGFEISCELFHYFVNNGTIELQYLKENNN